ncbi:MAG: nucleoside triphosphate pyrophosphohydrolase [Bdellovibrionales bacterium]
MGTAIDYLIEVMKRLRDPERGCPWDLAQTHKSLAADLLEEAYEVVEILENSTSNLDENKHQNSSSGSSNLAPNLMPLSAQNGAENLDYDHLVEELGDVLLHVVFHAQIGAENGSFDFEKIAQNVADKMVQRHPHVFGTRDVKTPDEVIKNWENDKAKEREKEAAKTGAPPSVLDGVNTALPALLRALKLQKRAARVGFEWDKPLDIIEKIHEEMNELIVEIEANNKDAMEDEFGDVLFVVINLARQLGIDPETALRRTNRKFERRFRGIETALLAQKREIKDVCLDEMETLWQEMKARERAPSA